MKNLDSLHQLMGDRWLPWENGGWGLTHHLLMKFLEIERKIQALLAWYLSGFEDPRDHTRNYKPKMDFKSLNGPGLPYCSKIIGMCVVKMLKASECSNFWAIVYVLCWEFCNSNDKRYEHKNFYESKPKLWIIDTGLHQRICEGDDQSWKYGSHPTIVTL